MLIGEYLHTIDDKKRVALPAKFRKELGRKVIITHGFDDCLALFAPKAWALFLDKLEKLSVGQSSTRRLKRYLLGGALEVEVDTAGRILVPDFLKSSAKLGTQVTIIGVRDRVEIWDKDRWQEYRDLAGKEADALAEELAKSGNL